MYSNFHILLNFHTNECFTITELPRSIHEFCKLPTGPFTYEIVMSQINESCHRWQNRVTRECVLSHMNASCHTWMRHATCEGVLIPHEKLFGIQSVSNPCPCRRRLISGTNRERTLVWSWWCKSNKRLDMGSKTRHQSASWAAYERVLSHMNEYLTYWWVLSQYMNEPLHIC